MRSFADALTKESYTVPYERLSTLKPEKYEERLALFVTKNNTKSISIYEFEDKLLHWSYDEEIRNSLPFWFRNHYV